MKQKQKRTIMVKATDISSKPIANGERVEWKMGDKSMKGKIIDVKFDESSYQCPLPAYYLVELEEE